MIFFSFFKLMAIYNVLLKIVLKHIHTSCDKSYIVTIFLIFFYKLQETFIFLKGENIKYQASPSYGHANYQYANIISDGKSYIFFCLTSCLCENSLDCMKHPGALEPFKRYSLTLHTRPDKDTCNMKHVNNSESTYGTTQFYFTEGCESSAAAFNVRHFVFRLFFWIFLYDEQDWQVVDVSASPETVVS